MKLIKPSYQILEQSPGIEGMFKQIELAGRTCYKSEDKITKDSAGKFVGMLIARGHTAMLEHGTVYLRCKIIEEVDNHSRIIGKTNPLKHYANNKYSKYKEVPVRKGWGSDDAFVTTNYRVLLENGWLDDLKYLCEPTEYHEERVTVKFITSIGIGRELLRHRVFSFANESTRYCNYSKDKFNNELTFIIPSWIKHLNPGHYYENPLTADSKGKFIGNALNAEWYYKTLLGNNKCKPEEAREILPLCTKSELVMTGFISDWVKVFLQRVDGTTGTPHPDMKALMEPVKQEFIERGLL